MTASTTASTISPLIIAVANRKGGTGKTTTAVNLAAQWSTQGYRTLLVDLDSQGHAAIGVGCGSLRLQTPGIHQLLTSPDMSMQDVIVPTTLENLWLAPADTEYSGQNTNIGMHVLRNALAQDSMRFQRIVIDTPPTLDSLLNNALVAAHGVLVPFVPHYLAEVGVKQLASLFYKVSTRYNPDLKLLGLLPVMLDRHITLHKTVLKNLATQFGKKRILRGIRSNITLAEAFMAGKPICEFAPRSAGGMDYHLMADELETFLFK